MCAYVYIYVVYMWKWTQNHSLPPNLVEPIRWYLQNTHTSTMALDNCTSVNTRIELKLRTYKDNLSDYRINRKVWNCNKYFLFPQNWNTYESATWAASLAGQSDVREEFICCHLVSPPCSLWDGIRRVHGFLREQGNEGICGYAWNWWKLSHCCHLVAMNTKCMESIAVTLTPAWDGLSAIIITLVTV